MKKTFAIILLFATTIGVFGQDGDLKKQTYFRFGIAIPSWKYEGLDGKEDWPDETKRIGGVFEVGSIFMLNSIKLSPGMRLGINVDYLSLNFNRFSLESDFGAVSENFAMIGSKLGPSFSYSPVNNLVLDAYFKFNPVWVAGNFISTDVEEDNEFWLGFMGIKYSVGMNVRYSILMVGLEFNPGFAKLRYFDKDEKELTQEYYGNWNDNGKRTPAPAMNFTIGLSF